MSKSDREAEHADYRALPRGTVREIADALDRALNSPGEPRSIGLILITFSADHSGGPMNFAATGTVIGDAIDILRITADELEEAEARGALHPRPRPDA